MNRTPASSIKHSLGRLENRFQTALAQRVREKKQAAAHLDLAALPDIYAPLRTFTEFLLPHLRFEQVDVSDETNIRCVWTRTDGREQISLDIDQLSSGEKSLITLFLPLLETEVSTLLNRIDLTPGPVSAPDTLMIIDEPEQHIRNAVSLLESKVKQAHRKNTAYWATGLNDSY